MSASSSPDRKQFAPSLSAEDRSLIAEEVEILAGLRAHLVSSAPNWQDPNYDEALLDLRDSLVEAHEDEVAQIVTQMSQIAHLSDHRQRHEIQSGPLNLESPYFGHMRVRQGERVRDILIGNQTLTSAQLPYPIIDWRHAPISRVYYCYREGDEYEEFFGGKPVAGEILAHRKVMILKGRLVRIEADQGVFQLDNGRWERLRLERPRLSGGEGSAPRPAAVSRVRERPGEDAGGQLRLGTGQSAPPEQASERFLTAVTGLIDPRQFELITAPEAGVVVIDGGAGSGKTTIALHRIAYLAYQDPARFQAQSMLAITYNTALARYMSKFLPALGVEGVRIEVLEEYFSVLRKRHYPTLNVGYAEAPPTTAIRFKQHPAALAVMERWLADCERELRRDLTVAVGDTPESPQVLAGWDALAGRPLAARLAEFASWVRGAAPLPSIGGFGRDWLARQRLDHYFSQEQPNLRNPATQALGWWQEAFLSLDRLRTALDELAPGEFSEAQKVEIRNRAFKLYSQREEYAGWQAEKQSGGVEPGDEEGMRAPTAPELDPEDDTLLLLFHTLAVGPLRNRRKRPLKVAHLCVDEAQDFGPLDLRVLIGLAAEPYTVTLAGDTEQRMILHNSFNRWEDVLAQLDLEHTAISPLEVGYRSSEEIMRFARAALGSLATDRSWVATRQGAPVELLRFTDPGQAVVSLSDALRQLVRREPSATVALIARYPEQADVYFDGLDLAEVPKMRRVAEQDFTFTPGIEVTDILQVKGLEFDYVLLLDVDAVTYPDDTPSRYLLHIGATRAAHQLWLVTCREPTPLLPDDLAAHLL